MPKRGQQRMDVELSPQIPPFRATRTGGKKLDVLLTCTRCGNDFAVSWKGLVKESPEYHTRSCPYCFKVSRIRRH